MSEHAGFTISELAEAVDLTPRTVRYYTAEGLLPPPDARGRYALYSEEHLDRLRLICRLKGAFLPLGLIRARLQGATPLQIRCLLAEVESRPATAPLNDLVASAPDSPAERIPAPAVRPEVESESTEPWRDRESDRWERFLLAPGVELHIRIPVPDWLSTQLDRLIADARTALSNDRDLEAANSGH